MRWKLQVVSVAVMTTWAAFPLPAQAPDFRWSGAVEAGRTLEVRGISGKVRALPAEGAEVEVEATRSGRRSDPESVRIEVVEHAGGATICAVYPSRGSSPNECRPGGGSSNVQNNDVSVDFVVRVPAGVHFSGHTVNGEIAVEGVRSDVSASTVNGDVRVRTTGFVARATTVNGDVVVEVPDGLDADFHASTVNGTIESDFPITVRGSMGRRSLRGSIGEGGRELRASTVNGSIRLRRL